MTHERDQQVLSRARVTDDALRSAAALEEIGGKVFSLQRMEASLLEYYTLWQRRGRKSMKDNGSLHWGELVATVSIRAKLHTY